MEERVKIPAAQIEFVDGGNTIWVHNNMGGTVMRIKCTGKIVTGTSKNSPYSYTDMIVEGDISFCCSEDVE